MHTITNTVIRNDSYYYNLRIPHEHVSTYGTAVRFKLGDVNDCRPNYITSDDVEQIVKRLTPLIMGSLRTGSKLDYRAAAKSMKPKITLLSDMLKEYLAIRDISERPVRLAVEALEAVSGDREISDYTREDVRAFLGYMKQRGVKTATVIRRLNSLSAIFSYSYAELDIDKRNPFTRVIIPKEGADVTKRGSFTIEQLVEGSGLALTSGSTVKLLMPILGETGCRLAEIVGLRVEDVDLKNEVLHIRPNSHRRLKTAGSERSLPLVGHALDAVRLVMAKANGSDWLFPQYIKEDGCYATHASNALNKWLKRDFSDLTAHSLRHTVRDRLRASEVPLEAIDQLGGWSSVGGVGSRYGQGYSVVHLRQYMDRIAIQGRKTESSSNTTV